MLDPFDKFDFNFTNCKLVQLKDVPVGAYFRYMGAWWDKIYWDEAMLNELNDPRDPILNDLNQWFSITHDRLYDYCAVDSSLYISTPED